MNTSEAKTIEPVYEDPFDIGAGGASLTLATQEGMLASNPALLPYGGKFFRWLGLKTILYPGKDSVDLTKEVVSNKGVSSEDEGQSQEAQTQALLDKVFTSPIHLGLAESLAFITNNGGISIFASAEPDLKIWKKGDPDQGAGLPSMVIHNETYAGALASLAMRTPFSWLSVGATAKYLYAIDQELYIDLFDQDSLAKAQDDLSNVTSQDNLKPKLGADVGTLIFLQGHHVDFRLASAVNNVGGYDHPGIAHENFQFYNVGLGLTFHGNVEAVHLSVDYRDASNVYKEEMFKRLHLGAKVMLRQYVGLAAGLYHGTPTVGAELDLIFLRVAASTYTREYGDHPGVDPRTIYLLSFSMGMDF